MPGLRYWLSLAVVLLCSRGFAVEWRYVARFVDGSEVEGDEVRDWHDTTAQPKLSEQPLLDETRPLRWLRDRTLALAPAPPMFIEMVGGDRLPGEVTAWRSGDESPYDLLPPHFIVEPEISVAWPDPRQRRPLRVLSRWVRRIVWQARGSDRYLPGTLLERDGRQLSFRSLRWQPDGVRLLVADGTVEVLFSQIAELHLPRADAWEAWYEQLAILSPSLGGRILRVETDGGLRATASTERFQARNNGSHPDHWYHAVQPAWCLEPLWLRYRTIVMRSYFEPHEAPLSLLEPVRYEQRSLLSAAWTWQADRNVQGGPLRAAGREFAWGLGVHAPCEVTFAVPLLVRSFRSRVALDEAAGHGGCARVAVYDGAQPMPRYESKILVGSSEVLEIGPLPLDHEDKGIAKDAATRTLKLVADPVSQGRPTGADPLDIRDTIDWLEPMLELDADLLRQEVAQRASRLVPAWRGWTVEEADSGPAMLVNSWDDTDNRSLRFRQQVVPRQRFLLLSQRVTLTPQQRALLLVVSRMGNHSTPSRLLVEADGELLGQFDVPPRHSLGGPDPLWVPLDEYVGRQITLRLTQPALGPQSVTDWRSAILVQRWPGLLPLFEDDRAFADLLTPAGETAQASAEAAYSGATSLAVKPVEQADAHRYELNVPIRETPRLGEYRFLRFAWKKQGGGRICLSIGHDDLWGPDNLGRSKERRTFRLESGSGPPSFGGALRIDRKPPESWVVVTRDLYNDFGEFTLTGLAFNSPDGEAAYFDHIYLGRSQTDFSRIEARPRGAPEQ